MNRFLRLLPVMLLLTGTSCRTRIPEPECLLPRPTSIEHQRGALPLNFPLRLSIEAPDTTAATLRHFVLASGLPVEPASRPDDTPSRSAADERPVLHLHLENNAALPTSEEGYRLTITRRGIELRSRGEAGLFYGIQTLLQLHDRYGKRLPALEITDAPRFSYRGLHLDVSRHFFDAAFVKKQLRMMATLKLNRLHWHLTDGAGWRVAIDRYPELTGQAAWRHGATWQAWRDGGGRYCRREDPQAAGGYYTKAEIRDVVAFADSLHITIIPEIEFPAHSEEVLAVYPALAVMSVVISIGVVGLTTLAACRVSLREKPAALLLPRAPAAGKRIFLERVGPLWRRMSFSQKTTARNMFRYKKRFYMTVLGVAGCTALLLIGFGLQDSIVEIVARQYGSVQQADLTISLSSDKALDEGSSLTETLAARDEVESWGAFYTRTVSVYADAAGAGELSVTLVAAEEPQKLTEYFRLESALGRELPFIDGSVVLTQKTAELLGAAAGDSIWVQGTDGSRVQLTLTGVTENYLGAYLYVTQNTLARLVADSAPNTVYVRTSCADDTQRQTLSTVLLGCNYVSSTAFTADSAAMYDSTITCINYVVVLIIACAAALAAVVLYNLISVNIGERKKELATIKVLGFFDKEVYRYIFREIELLSVIGAAVGLAIGVPLHQFVIRTVESEQMMFIRMLEPTSFQYSVALTLLFTAAVCRAMRRQVRSISMVESMKAPE